MSITDDARTDVDDFVLGEQIRVHDTRFPHGLRSARISRVIAEPDGSRSYAVRLGLGGEQIVEAACAHGVDDTRSRPHCTTCN